MTYKQLNKRITNYLKNEYLQQAIMLTAPWGAGKSHYIKNILIPHLHDVGKKCVHISAHGIPSIHELNRQLFLEANYMTNIANSAIAIGGKILAKTIAHKLSFDVTMSEQDWDTIYKSVDFTNTLLIIEDAERAHMDIVELLSYINLLCEQDGTKVLLVSNEDEWKQHDKYWQVKEKTIYETIHFEPELEDAIKQISKRYRTKMMQAVLTKSHIKRLAYLCKTYTKQNLRTFIFACDKTQELFNLFAEGNIPIEYHNKVEIFECIIFMSGRIAQGQQFQHETNSSKAWKESTIDYPVLYDFCLHFLQRGSIDILSAAKTLNEKNQAIRATGEWFEQDKDYCKLCQTPWEDTTARQAIILRLQSRIQNAELHCSCFMKLAVVFAVQCTELNINWDNTKQHMERQVKSKADEISISRWESWTPHPKDNWDEDTKQVFQDIKTRLLQSAKQL